MVEREQDMGEIPPGEVPGKVFIPVIGIKPGDFSEQGYPRDEAVWKKLVRAFLPKKKSKDDKTLDTPNWFKRTFENEEGKKNGKFSITAGGVVIIVGGAIIEHLRGWRDVKDLVHSVQEARKKWVEENIPLFMNIRKELQKDKNIWSIKEFIEFARSTSEIVVSPAFYTARNREDREIYVGFGIKYIATKEEETNTYPEILSNPVSFSEWELPNRRKEIEMHVSAQAEQQSRRLAQILNVPGESIGLVIGKEEISPEIREELFEMEGWDNYSIFDRL